MRSVESVNDAPGLSLESASVERAVHLLDSEIGIEGENPLMVPPGDLVVRWVSPATSAELHAQFFQDPTPTDVMTFPGDPEDDHAGDLAICPTIAASAAPENGTTFAEELTLYLVHGWLHLAGLNDRSKPEIEEMRAAEAVAMAVLKKENALLEATWAQKAAPGA